MSKPSTFTAAALLGGLILASGPVLAAPLPMNGGPSIHTGITQIAMTRSERMMMKKRMMRKKMMQRKMMRRHMMRDRMMHRM